MKTRPRTWIVCAAALVAVAAFATRYPLAAGEKAKPDAGEATVRQANRQYAEAFAKGDAKALAALWTENGEYDGLEGETLRGRSALEAAYGDFFKKNSKPSLDVHIDSVRMLGPRAAVEEGTLCCGLSSEKSKGAPTRFSAFLVLEDGGWRFASVREWVDDAPEPVTLADLAWMAGEWAGKGKQGEAKLSYAFDDNKTFLRGRYSVVRDGKVVRSGTQVLAKDPNGGLRSWQFESDGSFGEWAWTREKDRWMIEGSGTLPDGQQETATHLLVPIDNDNFTWQVLERTTGDNEMSAGPPVHVKRVKGDK